MYYRFKLEKDGKTTGLFHPLDEWHVPKENGIYDVVPKYFESLPYEKNFKGESESWFKEQGIDTYAEGLGALRSFYRKYGISIVEMKTEQLENIVDEDEFQVWCLIHP